MSFDLDRFRAATFKPRQATLPVPDLAVFFAEGTPPLWTVRGLSGEEIARSNEAQPRGRVIGAVVEALAAAAANPDQASAMKTLIGYGDEVPEDYAKRIDHLVAGSVAPALDREMAVKLFTHYPIVAYQLTNKILELTGLGADLGK